MVVDLDPRLGNMEDLGRRPPIWAWFLSLPDVLGKMTMVGMFAAGTTYEVTGKGFDPEVGEVRREDGRDGRNDLGASAFPAPGSRLGPKTGISLGFR